MEHALTEIAEYLLHQSWQIAAIFVLAAAACWTLRKASAHWRYLLWLVVLAKCLTPPLVTLPVPVLPPDPPQNIEPARLFEKYLKIYRKCLDSLYSSIYTLPL